MAKATNTIEVTEVELTNVALQVPQRFAFDWAERILIEQSNYDGFKPFELPTESLFEFTEGKLVKK